MEAINMKSNHFKTVAIIYILFISPGFLFGPEAYGRRHIYWHRPAIV